MNENQQKTLSVVSLITGIVGLLIFGIILGIISLITGLLSWEEKTWKNRCCFRNYRYCGGFDTIFIDLL